MVGGIYCAPARNVCGFFIFVWFGVEDSNLGHPQSKCGVLPTELTPSRCFTGNIYTLAC